MNTPVLCAKGIKKNYHLPQGFWSKKTVLALNGVDMALFAGETLAVVGASGSGKSTLARILMGLIPASAGEVSFLGQKLVPPKYPKAVRRHMQMVFQDPFSSLNPRMPVGDIVSEGLFIHNLGTARQRLDQAKEALSSVGISPSRVGQYPKAFSGGERQRIAIARAIALRPQVLICDEPVSALDVSVQKGILELFSRLQEDLKIAMLFITHDLRVAAEVAKRVAVMQDGQVVEEGEAKSIFAAPGHPYTQALLAAIPGRHSARLAKVC